MAQLFKRTDKGVGAVTSKRDLARYDQLVKLGCICCYNLKLYSAPDMHHILSGGRRIGNQATIPLCPYHHRGVDRRHDVGPSLADGSRIFARYHGTERDLLKQVNELISPGKRGER